MHSKKFNTIKSAYERGNYTKSMVMNLVIKGYITAEEYTEITGDTIE